MDTRRLILFFVFSFSLVLLWQEWQRQAAGPQKPAAAEVPAPAAAPSPAPQPSGKAVAGAPAPKAAAPSASVPSGDAPAARHERIRVTTDTVVAEIDTLGGDIVRLELPGYKDALGKSPHMVLLGSEHRYSAQSGLTQAGLPNHRTLYAVSETDVALKPGQDRVELRLTASEAGVKVTKTLTFHRGTYLVDTRFDIENASEAAIATHAYFQLVRDGQSPASDNRMAYTYTGAAAYTPQDRFVKVSFGDIDKGKLGYTRTPDSGWVAMIQHYFVGAILPPDGLTREIYTRKLSEDFYAVGVILPLASIAPGGSGSISIPMYLGPQEQARLKAISPTLDLVVDYGWLTVIAAPLFWVLELFHGWLRNWGLAIILLTVVIKLLFFPLSAASYRSMARMKMVAPRLTKIREAYPDDRMKQNQAMMELYKTEKINPLGGCLPIAVQIPVFIALYWVLLAAVELRDAPFYGWIKDLSAPDPWYVLPALMMLSMVLQTRMNPTPPDPVQAKVMMIMPFAFGVMFFFFPAGLVLYWLVNNILSILQQWQITRMISAGAAAATTAKKR